jgi:hypothetical protein
MNSVRNGLLMRETGDRRRTELTEESASQCGFSAEFITRSKDDPDPKAVSCYGLYLPEFKETWLRFVDGRPVSGITSRFLGWCAEKLEALGKKVLLLIWDNARSWHISREERRWLGEHNREVKKSGKGVRIVSCLCYPSRVRG